MNIALIGYGKMGHEIEALLADMPEYTIVTIAVQHQGDKLSLEQLDGADVAIDFSHADLMPTHLVLYEQAHINAIIGTTGWEYDRESLQHQLSGTDRCIIIGSNFSAGVQTFMAIVREASRRCNELGDYDAFAREVHHTQKADSPSGTAKTLAHVVLNEMDTKTSILYGDAAGKIDAQQFQIVSQRGGRNPGFHSVTFENGNDQIEVQHQAFSRQGFASGAITAAELAMKRSGLIMYEDLFNEGEIYG